MFRNVLSSSSSDLIPPQFTQLVAVALELQPAVIVELGRGFGHSTCAFTEAAHQLGGKTKVLSVCKSDLWQQTTVPLIRDIVSPAWFDSLQAARSNILEFDFAAALAGCRSALLFWDAHGFDVAEYVLGVIMPLLVPIPHQVIMHDLTDSRFDAPDHMAYGEHGLWKGRNDWSGPRLKLGHIDSVVEQAVAAVDFTTRNRLTFDSADHSLAHDLSAEQRDEMRRLIGDLFDTRAHWFHFTLNEHAGPYTFPRFTPRARRS
jgi:hypothetical protein